MKNKKICMITIFLLTFVFQILFSINNVFAYETTIDDIISSGDSFIRQGESQESIDEAKLGEASNFLYGLFLGAGILVSVVVGLVLGIKFMVGSVEEKAEYKQALLIYVVGVVVLFGAFGIWKLAIKILGNI